MNDVTEFSEQTGNRVGRPRRGTESARTATLLNAATRVFLRDGYGPASIDKVAGEAGVSTRTIYERYKNKADLLHAVITQLVERDITSLLEEADLERMELQEALTVIASTITARVRDPDSIALFRIVTTEAQRFPELAEKMRSCTKARIDNTVANYFRTQIASGTLAISDADAAAGLFMQMVCGELHQCLLFANAEALARFDCATHVKRVVGIFLYGAAPRADQPAGARA